MKKLTLLRHAKSSWKDHNLTDHDRTLNSRGRRDAPDMASRLIEAGLKPDRILCSSAVRTKETAEHFIDAQAVESNSVHFEQSLYLASPGTMLSLIEGTDNAVRHLMIIAHNPGLEVLGRQLHPGAPVNLPTCGMLHFQLHQEDFILSTGTEIEMVFYDFPKNRAD